MLNLDESISYIEKGLEALQAEEKTLTFNNEEIGAEVKPYCNELRGFVKRLTEFNQDLIRQVELSKPKPETPVEESET